MKYVRVTYNLTMVNDFEINEDENTPEEALAREKAKPMDEHVQSLMESVGDLEPDENGRDGDTTLLITLKVVEEE